VQIRAIRGNHIRHGEENENRETPPPYQTTPISPKVAQIAAEAPLPSEIEVEPDANNEGRWTCPWQSPKMTAGPQEFTRRPHTALRGGQRNSCYRVNSPRIAGTGNPNSMSEFQLRDSLVLKTPVAIANSKTLSSSHCE